MPKLKFFYPEPKHVYLVPDIGKLKYIHQYGGTACNIVEITEPINLGVIDCKYTSPSWWHLRTTDTDSKNHFFAERKKKYIDIITENKKRNKDFNSMVSLYKKYYRWMMKKTERRIYLPEIADEIERKIRKTFPVNNIQSIYLFMNQKAEVHGIEVESPIIEAYMPVYIMKQDTESVEKGHLIWQNSD